jgi:uncharacterized protein GlcG (DUF336 family)
MGGVMLGFGALVATAAHLSPMDHRSVSLEMANTLVEAALASCRATNRNAAVAVVDQGGNLIALQRGDQIGPHNTRAAERKAFTALSTKTSTSTLAERAATDPGSRYLASHPDLLLLGGGLPLVYEGEVIGGIGVAGSGGSISDELCARAALAQSIDP